MTRGGEGACLHVGVFRSLTEKLLSKELANGIGMAARKLNQKWNQSQSKADYKLSHQCPRSSRGQRQSGNKAGEKKCARVEQIYPESQPIPQRGQLSSSGTHPELPVSARCPSSPPRLPLPVGTPHPPSACTNHRCPPQGLSDLDSVAPPAHSYR